MSISSPPHRDYFTQFLADLDSRAEPSKALERKRALILYGIPGTGKTFTARALANRVAATQPSGQAEDPPCPYFAVKQFHPSYSYQDFVIGIRPTVTEDGLHVTYPVVPSDIYRAAAEAVYLRDQRPVADDNEHPFARDTCVLILDEINRADLAKVFGELMYCLEYRGQNHCVSLPHRRNTPQQPLRGLFCNQQIPDPFDGGQRFYLPENLLIIGTMNTVDRSLSGFDVALQRRFAWHRLEFTQPSLRQAIRHRIQEKYAGGRIQNQEAFVVRATDLNNWLCDQNGGLPLTDYQKIGHAYFSEIVPIVLAGVPANPPVGTIGVTHLQDLWLYHLEPLIEEYLGMNYEEASIPPALGRLKQQFIVALP